jgi:hypothetical protein
VLDLNRRVFAGEADPLFATALPEASVENAGPSGKAFAMPGESSNDKMMLGASADGTTSGTSEIMYDCAAAVETAAASAAASNAGRGAALGGLRGCSGLAVFIADLGSGVTSFSRE